MNNHQTAISPWTTAFFVYCSYLDEGGYDLVGAAVNKSSGEITTDFFLRVDEFEAVIMGLRSAGVDILPLNGNQPNMDVALDAVTKKAFAERKRLGLDAPVKDFGENPFLN